MTNKKKKVSIYTLSEELGVSTSTVSRALNHHPSISAEVREKVQIAAKLYNFRPRMVSSRNTVIYAVIQHENGELADFDNFMGRTLEGIEEYCHHENLELGIYSASISELNNCDIVRELRRRGADGAIILRSSDESTYMRRMQEQSFPYFCLLNNIEKNQNNNFMLDEKGLAHQAVKYLIDEGHRNIGIICDRLHLPFARLRLEGYLEALSEAGIAKDENFIFSPQGNYSSLHGGLEIGREGVESMLGNDRKISAIFATNDMIAKGTLAQLYQRNISVPGQISVMGFDDYPETSYLCPPLSTVCVPYKEIGYEGARQVHRLYRGLNVLWPDAVLERLNGKLIIRNSTGKFK